MTHTTELKAHLENGIKELEAELSKLRAAIMALDGNGAQPTARPRAAKANPEAKPVSKATVKAEAKPAVKAEAKLKPQTEPQYDVVPAGKLSKLLQASDGLTTAELAQQTNGAGDQVLQMLKELEQAGQARRTGVRRSTRWHAGAPREAAGKAKPAATAAKSKRATRSRSVAAGKKSAARNGSARARKTSAATKTKVPEQSNPVTKADAEGQIAAALDPVVAS